MIVVQKILVDVWVIRSRCHQLNLIVASVSKGNLVFWCRGNVTIKALFVGHVVDLIKRSEAHVFCPVSQCDVHIPHDESVVDNRSKYR